MIVLPILTPTLAEFTVCHGFGCTERSMARLNSAQWQRVAALFSSRARTAAAEREQIARGVALIETMVGPQTGTDARQWTHQHNIILPNLGDSTQLDCVDDAVNTWTYMTLMERAKLLRFHRVAKLSNAGSLTDPFMRNTAVLQELNGGYFAIDASFVDAGVPPRILPLETWINTLPTELPAAPVEPKRPSKVARG